MTNGEDMEFEGSPVPSPFLEDDYPEDAELAPAPPTEEEIADMQAALDALPKYYALIGVPGSGKSDLAAAMSGYFDLEIVDGYAQKLAADLDIALGLFASYVPNLMVAMEREKAEHLNRKEQLRSAVTCGTLVETLGYAALQVEYHNMQITTPQQQAIIARETLASQVVSLMLQDLMRYHKYFYLPLPAYIEVPGQDPKYDNGTRSLDNAIGQIIQALGVPVVRVTGSLEQQMETVKAEIEGN